MKAKEIIIKITYIGIEDDIEPYSNMSLGDIIYALNNPIESTESMRLYYDFTAGDLDFELVIE